MSSNEEIPRSHRALPEATASLTAENQTAEYLKLIGTLRGIRAKTAQNLMALPTLNIES
jgi:hypothetical protein